MNNSVKELFLTEYFRQVAVMRTLCDKEIFDFLAKIFVLSKSDSETLWAAVEQDIVTDIVTMEDANQYKRVLQFSTINGMPIPISDETKSIIAIKCLAIADIASIDMCAERNATSSQILQGLYTRASQGYICAMHNLGVMQCEGNEALCIECDFEKGFLNLEKAAHWGHIPSILTLIYFLCEPSSPKRHIKHSLKYYRNLLYTFVNDTPYRDLLHVLNIKNQEPCSNAQLLLELFARRIIKKEIFNKIFAQVVYGDTIDIFTKKRLLSDSDEKYISELANIPMHLLRKTFEADSRIFSSLPFIDRDAEREWLRYEINRLGNNFFKQRKPLCLCCDDRFVLETYRQGFEKMKSKGCKLYHIVTIDIAELSEADLQPNADNVFVTSCKNNAQNLYLFVLQGNIPVSKINVVREFLQSNKRAKFKINQPSVTLDLSPIIPICFCDRQNADKLLGAVNIGMMAALSREERQLILRQKINDVNRRANVTLRIDDDGIELLSCHSLDVALMALDKLYREHSRNEVADIDDISFCLAEAEKSHYGNRSYGFGGYSK